MRQPPYAIIPAKNDAIEPAIPPKIGPYMMPSAAITAGAGAGRLICGAADGVEGRGVKLGAGVLGRCTGAE